jgi:hypothetical protein
LLNALAPSSLPTRMGPLLKQRVLSLCRTLASEGAALASGTLYA